jgi:hypothetical protein
MASTPTLSPATNRVLDAINAPQKFGEPTEPSPDPGTPAARPFVSDKACTLRATTESTPTGSVVKPEVDANPFRDMGGSRSPDFNHVLLRETLATMWVPSTENDTQTMHMRAGMAALRAFRPTDEIEGMLAAQAVALHFVSMECLRRAMLPDQPGEFQSKLCKDGVNLARGVADMLDALDRKRGKGRPQVVRVERVVVEAGGRAIVGNVSPGADAESAPAAIEAEPSTPTLDLSPTADPVMAERRGRGEG